MTGHRYEAHATIVAGQCERGVNGHVIQLITLTLTDAGPVAMPDGTDYARPDVICPLRASEARWLAGQLIELADHACRSRTAAR